MENNLKDNHFLSPCICKCCIVFKQFDELNFDGLAGKHKECQILHYMVRNNADHLGFVLI